MRTQESCGYPIIDGVTEWTCNGTVRFVVVGVSGSGYVETRMPRCKDHVKPTVAGLNPPNSEYPYHSLRSVEWVQP